MLEGSKITLGKEWEGKKEENSQGLGEIFERIKEDLLRKGFN